MRRATAIPAFMLSALAVAGITVWASAITPSGIEDFDRGQTAADQVELGENTLGVVPDSVRLIAEEDGVKFFAATGSHDELCLILDSKSHPEDRIGGCSGGDWLGMTTMTGLEVQLYATGMGDLEPEGWRQLSPNLYARD